jgi:hypothetical protein
MRTARIATLIVASFTLLVVGCSGSGTPTSEATSHFKTPEEAVTAYLDGVAHSDLDKLLSACAIGEVSKGFRFDLYANNLRGAPLPMTLAPTSDSFYVELNKAQLTSQICQQVKVLTYSLLTLSSDEAADMGMFMQMESSRISSFISGLDSKRLTGLKMQQIGAPNLGSVDESKIQAAMTRSALALGADEQTERMVLFSFEGDYYYLGFTLLRYGDDWKVYQQYSNLAGTDLYGVPQKTTVQDFQSML